eukprot:TRINITY_DN11031_c0_g1_i1.p1 TRINITY_DN11031_c0_g1~~TRINITY_DN11031_c0_g1_i1.p1  ORF type:complete len:164 (-),score=15.45 TRINITY_DN11031_c0_g1_i1:146-637(-)
MFRWAQRFFTGSNGKLLIRFTDVIQVWDVIKAKAAPHIQFIDGDFFQVVFGMSGTNNFVIFLYCHTQKAPTFVEVFCNWLKDTYHFSSPLEKLFTHCIRVSMEAEMVRKERKKLTEDRLQLALERFKLECEMHTFEEKKREFEIQMPAKKRRVPIKKEKEETN